MARVLIANEFGGGRGHTAAISALIDALGHSDEARVLVQPRIAACLPGAYALPSWPDPKPFEVSGFWDTLDKMGLWEPDLVRPRIDAYRKAFDDFHPDLVVGDYAPMAMILARSRGCRAVAFGSPFFTPASSGQACRVPDGQPLRLSQAVADKALGVLEEAGLHIDCPIDQAVAGPAQWVRTIQALDPLSGASNRVSVIAESAQPSGRIPEWPPGCARIACYLRPAPKRIAALESLVERVDGAAICSTGAVSEATRWGGRVKISPTGFEPRTLLREADILVHNGGAGLCMQAALSATWQVLLPNTQEQMLNARLVERSGWGVIHTGGALRLARTIRTGLRTQVSNPPSNNSISLRSCIRRESL